MDAQQAIAVLNVSNIQESFAWFNKLGWQKSWEWGDPPDFGSVCSGSCEIFLCENAQGGRGKGANADTFGSYEAVRADKGVWICVMVQNVDVVYRHCLEQGLDVTMPPRDTEWHLREMHVRHPDGHVFRVGHRLEEDD